MARDANSITVWWSVTGDPVHADQNELMRCIVAEASYYRLAFTRKGSELPAADRAAWLDSLAAAQLESPPK